MCGGGLREHTVWRINALRCSPYEDFGSEQSAFTSASLMYSQRLSRSMQLSRLSLIGIQSRARAVAIPEP